MDKDVQELARKIDQISGIVGALLAVAASQPGLTDEALNDANRIMGTLTPAPIDYSSEAQPPIRHAANALSDIAAHARAFSVARATPGATMTA